MIIIEDDNILYEEPRIGFVPVNSNKTIEVYIHPNDGGNVPHFHVRKYSASGKGFEWETCIRFDSADYFLHGKYKDKLPNRKVAKELDKMLRTINTTDIRKRTYWLLAIDDWNANNSSVTVDRTTEQPDYSQ